MGLSVKEFYALTYRQLNLLIDYNNRKADAVKSEMIDRWRQTRLIAYLSSFDNLKDKNQSIYDFYPLPGDPTPKDIEKERQKQIEEDGKWMKQVIENVRKLNLPTK